MLRRTTFVLLSLVVTLCYSQSWTGQVSQDMSYNITFGPFNLQNQAMLKVSKYTLPVYACIVPEEFGLPHWTQFSADNCAFYYNFTGGEITENLLLRNTMYILGVYLSGKVEKTDSTNVTFDLTAVSCAANQYWDGTMCREVQDTIKSDNSTKLGPYDFTANQYAYWTWENVILPNQTVGTATFQLVFPGDEQVDADAYVMLARFNAVPSADHHNFVDKNATLSLETPLIGTWVFGVHFTQTFSNVEAKFMVNLCTFPMTGPTCELHVVNSFDNSSLVAKPGVYEYYRFIATPMHGLFVSVTTNNGSDIPHIYASRGQIPNPKLGLADISNCNREYCDQVRSIAHNVTKDEDWYVAVTASVTTGNTTYAIWYGHNCISGCEDQNHGECAPSGRCECEIDYEGIACEIPKGLGPQYIVLIIIASLVVASAIIGFVAWAYMRKKRANYEIVS